MWRKTGEKRGKNSRKPSKLSKVKNKPGSLPKYWAGNWLTTRAKLNIMKSIDVGHFKKR